MGNDFRLLLKFFSSHSIWAELQDLVPPSSAAVFCRWGSGVYQTDRQIFSSSGLTFLNRLNPPDSFWARLAKKPGIEYRRLC